MLIIISYCAPVARDLTVILSKICLGVHILLNIVPLSGCLSGDLTVIVCLCVLGVDLCSFVPVRVILLKSKDLHRITLNCN